MQIIVIILIVIVAIIALLLIVALFTNKDYAVERQIIINRPVAEVFDYIKRLKNQDNYSKWVMIDPAMRKDFKGVDGTEGFTYAWDSDNKQAGQGEQTITKITEGERVDVKVQFIKPFKGLADIYTTTETVDGNKTLIKWGMASSMAYPMNAMLIFVDMGEMLGKDLSISLNNLKEILEK